MIGISTSATTVKKIPSMNKAFISVEEAVFRMYLTSTRGASNDCFIRKLLVERPVVVLTVTVERYETNEGSEKR